MTSHSSPQIRVFLAFALLVLFSMVTLGVSPTRESAVPALGVWAFLALAYASFQMVQARKPVRHSR